MESPKRTKLGLLMIGLCSFAHSHEYAGPLVNNHNIIYPSSYPKYYEHNNILSRQDYESRLVTSNNIYPSNLYTPNIYPTVDSSYIYENYKRIDPRRIIPF